jgi:hypothetical protein
MKKLCLILALLGGTLAGAQATFAQTQPMHVALYRETPLPLYLNCGNEVAINIENYPFWDKIRVEVEGAELMPTMIRNVFTIVPNQAKVTIKAFEDEKLISESKHQVRLLPKPEVNLLIGEQPYQARAKRYTIEELQKIVSIKAVQNYEVAQSIPKDCRYRVEEFEVYVDRKGKIIKEQVVKDEQIDLSEFVKDLQSGDLLMFEVKAIKRMNFRGIVETVTVGEQVFSVVID